MTESAKSPQKRKRDIVEKSSNSVNPKTPKTKDELTSDPLARMNFAITYNENVSPDELIGMAVGVLQEHDVLKVDGETGRMYLIPDKLPPTPGAPVKDEVFLPSPNTRFGGDQNRHKKALDFGNEDEVFIVDPQEDAQDEEDQEWESGVPQ